MENGTEDIQETLHRHFLEHGREVDGDHHVDLMSFARESPFDFPDAGELEKQYEDCDFSDLRALHEHARDAQRNYFNYLQGAAAGQIRDDEQTVRDRWRHFCEIIIRDRVVETILHNAVLNGPEAASGTIENALQGTVQRRPAQPDTLQEIAAKILRVLDGKRSEWPNSTSDLLNRVDKLRGVKPRTSYRYLHERMGQDKPDKMYDWKEWAQSKV